MNFHVLFGFYLASAKKCRYEKMLAFRREALSQFGALRLFVSVWLLLPAGVSHLFSAMSGVLSRIAVDGDDYCGNSMS